MDMSKLPRMSQTPPPPPEERDPQALPPPTPAYMYSSPGDVGGGGFAEAWISIAVGAIMLLAYPYTCQWLLSKVSSYKPPFLPITSFDPTTGVTTEIPYSQSIFFFGHLCVFLFALVLIVDGLVLFTRRLPLMMAAFGLTALATGLNLVYVIKATMAGEGLPLVSALAVAFGVYIAIHQWRLISVLRALRAYRRS